MIIEEVIYVVMIEVAYRCWLDVIGSDRMGSERVWFDERRVDPMRVDSTGCDRGSR